jgi:hypothetical protein
MLDLVVTVGAASWAIADSGLCVERLTTEKPTILAIARLTEANVEEGR